MAQQVEVSDTKPDVLSSIFANHIVEESEHLEAILWPLEYTVVCTHTSTNMHTKQTNKTFRNYMDYIVVFTTFCETVDY